MPFDSTKLTIPIISVPLPLVVLETIWDGNDEVWKFSNVESGYFLGLSLPSAVPLCTWILFCFHLGFPADLLTFVASDALDVLTNVFTNSL